MKTTFVAATLWCLALGIASPRAQAGASPEALRAEVFAAREAVWRAWFANDREILDRMLPPEFIGLGWGGGDFDSRDSALAAAAEFANAQGRLRRLEFRDDRVQVFGDVVTVFANYLVELELDGQVTTRRGRATEVFVRREGTWTNPAWHLDSGR